MAQPISINQSNRYNPQQSTSNSIWPPSSSASSSVGIHPAPLFVAGSFGSAQNSSSFGSRFYPSCSPAQLLNPLDPNDFKCRISSSIESEHGSLIRALNGDIAQREDEHCRNYSCCGLPLNDMHALLEHFEENHVLVLGDPNPLLNHPFPPSSPSTPTRSNDSALAGALGAVSNHNRSLSLSMTGGVAAFDPDDMEIEDSPPSSSSSSAHSSPEANGAPLPNNPHHLLLQQQRHHSQVPLPPFRSNGGSLTSPPDTPMLSTPISPLPGMASFSAFPSPWNSSSDPSHHAATSSPNNTHIPTGPAAFDTTAIHLPTKASNNNNSNSPSASSSSAHNPHYSLFSHPYAATFQKRHSMFAGTGLLRSSSAAAGSSSPSLASASSSSALNSYAGYSDYSTGLPGAISSHSGAGVLGLGPTAFGSGSSSPSMGGGLAGESSIPPALLFGGGAGSGSGSSSVASTAPTSELNTPMTTPAQSRAPSPSSRSSNLGASSSKNNNLTATASTTLSRPAASLLLSKPFKCPKPGCMKSYKQANGLKYHMTHGQCNFNPPAELAAMLSVEGGGLGLSEREAERKLRPYCCQVPPCQRRYKNMNGLRYHYQHSGDHGAIGLALLASGNHDATRSPPSPPPPAAAVKLEAGLNGNSHGNSQGGQHQQQLSQTQQSAFSRDSPLTTAPLTSLNSLSSLNSMNTLSTLNTMSSYGGVGGLNGLGMRLPFVTQSQPASAYASPWASPRSGSPYGSSNVTSNSTTSNSTASTTSTNSTTTSSTTTTNSTNGRSSPSDSGLKDGSQQLAMTYAAQQVQSVWNSGTGTGSGSS